MIAAITILISACELDQRNKISLSDRISDGSADNIVTKKNESFLFGFDPRSSPEEDARQYLPFLDYLRKETGYSFELRFCPNDSTIVEEIGKGKFHFAAAGSVTYLHAREKYGAKLLARGVNIEGRAEYRSAIAVAPGSNINTIEDLRGKRFAFGNYNSTQGHLIPRIALFYNNISFDDLARFKWMESHVDAANAIISGEFDACGLQDTLALNLEREGKLKIIYLSQYYPSSGLIASKEVPNEVVDKIKKALVAFEPEGKDKAGLYNWHQTEMSKGFIGADEDDYSQLLEWLQYFNLLN